jgi:mitogen-activated protein kinase kinase 7
MQSKPKDSKDVLETSSLNIKTSMLNLEKMIKNENNHHSNGANNIMHRGPLAFDLSAADQRPARPSLAATSFQPFSVTNSTKTTNKLDVIDHEKYNKIKENANYLLINNERIKTSMNDFIDICELGSGTCGLVKKMQHKQTGQLIAVKQMRIAGNAEENKRIIMDLDVVLKCHNCENIVSCLGYFISDSDVWICMDLMTMCFDKLIKLTKKPIPEPILGKLTLCTLQALNFLKQTHNVIHRDIKPSNLLINKNGEIKLCDFGISGTLVDSKVQTRNAGCAGYMAPERIKLENSEYDIRADVWSLGITLVELATGEYPFKNCLSEFSVMTAILDNDPPKLEGDQFSHSFKEFVRLCLIKDVEKRPKYNILLQNSFIQHYKNENVDIKGWFIKILEENKNKVNFD